jgi:hypothetical protein
MTQPDVTYALKSAVRAYLLARAYAETMREKVERCYREALEIFPLYEDRNVRNSKKRIYKSKYMYLSTDEETRAHIYEDVNFQLRKNGIKPDEMSDDHCPACVAEHLQAKTEWLICDAAAEMMRMGISGQDLCGKLCGMGIEKYREFIDLNVRLVVSLPDFENPMH